jgi:hypothetical protein
MGPLRGRHEIGEHGRRAGRSQGIQNRHQIDELLRHGAGDRRQHSGGGKRHPHDAQHHSADRAFERHPSETAAQV